MRQWLRLCDNNNSHSKCHDFSNCSTGYSPTRLIDVGREGDEFVRLCEPDLSQVVSYIALSHPWGEKPHFVTNVNNLPQHMKGIKLHELPRTFLDAVCTTRALEKRYLWIDSMCIIQGDGGDFHIQASQMESVFSSAYCVLAASRARNQRDGFLGPRRERSYVTMTGGPDGDPYYICENIDDFNLHVLDGHLNTRGWVFQEHALARRTIFFTDYQTYFECGEGVRCETLTNMAK